MSKKVMIFGSVVSVLALLVSVLPVMGGGTTTATTFILQNLENTPASVALEYHNEAGTVISSTSGINIAVGASAAFDQRYASGDPTGGTGAFKGSVVALSDKQLGSVVNLMRVPSTSGNGAVNGYESYNGFSQNSVGTTVILPQILKAVSSGGLVYNTSIAIQNTTAAAITATLTFTPDPVMNAAVCKTTCISSPASADFPIPASGSITVDQEGQATPAIGDVFFGSVKIVATGAVAVQVVSTGATAAGMDQQLLAYPSYSAGTTNPIAMLSVYKSINSLGLSYSTAFLIANLGTTTSTVTIQYSADLIGTVSGTDTFDIPAGAVKNVDQRYDAASITSATFLGSATVQGTQPIAVMANLRGGPQYAFTYDGVTSGSASVYLPVAYTNINSGGYNWSSTAIIKNYANVTATVTLKYTDVRSGQAALADATVDIGPMAVKQVDTRYSGSTNISTDSTKTFYGAIVLSSNQPEGIGAMVQTRGAGTSGDALLAYKGLGQ